MHEVETIKYTADAGMKVAEELKRRKTLCMQYNALNYDKPDEKRALLKQIFGKIGENFTVEPNLFCDFGYNVEIGENFYSNHNLTLLDCGKITFGDNVFIGPNCGFYAVGHAIDATERNNRVYTQAPITVGNSVWFGGHVSVMMGVTIGDNCVIGAGSVVTKDIPANSIAVGNPCKVVKQI